MSKPESVRAAFYNRTNDELSRLGKKGAQRKKELATQRLLAAKNQEAVKRLAEKTRQGDLFPERFIGYPD